MRTDSAVYKLELPCRALAAAVDPTQHLFLLGTFSLKGKNQLYLLDYREDASLCECLATWLHPHEVWQIAACPSTSQKDLFFTTHGTGDGTTRRNATLWTKERGTSTGLGKVTSLTLDVKSVLWEPQGFDVSTVQAVTPTGLASVSLDQDGTVVSSIDIGAEVSEAAWDPLHADVCAVSAGERLYRADLRQKKAECIVDEAHPTVTSLQYNPNRQYHILTGGDDGCMRMWDVRHAKQSLRSVQSHDHWVTSAQHNPFHEQLILSSSTDRQGSVKLWSLPSVSSRTTPATATNSLLKSVSDYNDSVYRAAWSALSPWIFASVSYTSKVMIHQVPRETKYSILLSE